MSFTHQLQRLRQGIKQNLTPGVVGGIMLILFGILVLAVPEILVALVAMALIVAGVGSIFAARAQRQFVRHFADPVRVHVRRMFYDV